MIPIRADAELWNTSLMPEGIIEKWLVPNGAFVEIGDPVVTLRVEDALHELVAPTDGWIAINAKTNSVIEPGAVVGHITAWAQ